MVLTCHPVIFSKETSLVFFPGAQLEGTLTLQVKADCGKAVRKLVEFCQCLGKKSSSFRGLHRVPAWSELPLLPAILDPLLQRIISQTTFLVFTRS